MIVLGGDTPVLTNMGFRSLEDIYCGRTEVSCLIDKNMQGIPYTLTQITTTNISFMVRLYLDNAITSVSIIMGDGVKITVGGVQTIASELTPGGGEKFKINCHYPTKYNPEMIWRYMNGMRHGVCMAEGNKYSDFCKKGKLTLKIKADRHVAIARYKTLFDMNPTYSLFNRYRLFKLYYGGGDLFNGGKGIGIDHAIGIIKGLSLPYNDVLTVRNIPHFHRWVQNNAYLAGFYIDYNFSKPIDNHKSYYPYLNMNYARSNIEHIETIEGQQVLYRVQIPKGHSGILATKHLIEVLS